VSKRPFRRVVTWAAACLTLAACGGDDPPPAPDASSQRSLAQGEIVGFAHAEHAAQAWKGIPFAKAPIGPLRWRAPLAPEPWSGQREALVSGAPCVQYDMTDSGAVSGDEDCLFLDVYAPRFAADAVPKDAARLPVMVWIHGGGNSIGSAEIYDAARLAAENEVIVVTIQYRLGVFGWLSHPALRAAAGNADDASGNFGTLDTIRALEWVRKHVSAFGGDPGNITIFGESAGGIDVFALLLSPRAKGLFHRAISQSGMLTSATRAQAENFIDAEDPGLAGSLSEFLLSHIIADGRAADREAAKPLLAAMTADETLAYLRGKSAAELISVFDGGAMGGMYFVPQILRDGHVIVDADPLEALRSAELHNAVPTIVGTNRDETLLFSMMGSPHVRRLFGIPIGFKDELAFRLGGEYGGLLWKAQGADQPAAAMRAGGRSDVWAYRFDWDEQGKLLWLDLDRLLGACHALDVLFVFGFTDLGRWTDNVFADVESAEQLSKRMRSYWTQFARSGDPGRGVGGDLPHWQPWELAEDAAKYLVFDSDAGGGLRMESAAVDVDRVVELLAEDPRFATTQARCEAFKDMVQFSGEFEPEDYEAFAGGACTDFPLPERPPLGG
jgi:para-nitrobenzyl esterase